MPCTKLATIAAESMDVISMHQIMKPQYRSPASRCSDPVGPWPLGDAPGSIRVRVRVRVKVRVKVRVRVRVKVRVIRVRRLDRGGGDQASRRRYPRHTARPASTPSVCDQPCPAPNRRAAAADCPNPGSCESRVRVRVRAKIRVRIRPGDRGRALPGRNEVPRGFVDDEALAGRGCRYVVCHLRTKPPRGDTGWKVEGSVAEL